MLIQRVLKRKDGIPVDQKLRSNVRHIMAVGDCLGGLQFTHLAGYQGALAAFNCVQGIQAARSWRDGPGRRFAPE